MNRLSPRTFDTVLRSPGVEDCPKDPPREKFPKAPIGGKPALCGAVDHGEEGAFAPGLKGAVVLRLNAPNADEVSTDLPAAPLSLPFSSWWASWLLSRKSVLLLNNDGGGSVVLKSSRKKRLPPALVGDAKGLPDWMESLVSRRRLPGRDDVGDETPKAVEILCGVDIDDFRPAIPLTGVFSLEVFCGGGLRGELTDVENN